MYCVLLLSALGGGGQEKTIFRFSSSTFEIIMFLHHSTDDVFKLGHCHYAFEISRKTRQAISEKQAPHAPHFVTAATKSDKTGLLVSNGGIVGS